MAKPAHFNPTADLTAARSQHSATLLLDGRVLVAGGTNGATLSTAEIYNPATGNWTLTGSLAASRFFTRRRSSTGPRRFRPPAECLLNERRGARE